MTAVFEITDGTTTIDLLRGPWYIRGWRPAISQYKNSGVFIDSPLADYRSIAFATLQNVTERIDLALAADSADLAATYVSNLLGLLQQAANYWISNGIVDPVYIKTKSKDESNLRYSLIVTGTLADIENPFAAPFLQNRCKAVMDNLVLITEHQEWTSVPPGEALTLQLTENSKSHNYFPDGTFEMPVSIDAYTWFAMNSPTIAERTADRSYAGRYSFHITGTAGAERGAYETVDGLENGVSYQITAKCMAVDGIGKLTVFDGDGTNPVSDSTTQRNVERLSNTSFETDLSTWSVINEGDGWLTATRSNSQAYAGTWAARLEYYEGIIASSKFKSDDITLSDGASSIDASMPYYIDTQESSWSIWVGFRNDAGDQTQMYELNKAPGSTGQWYVASRKGIPVPSYATKTWIEVRISTITPWTNPSHIMYIDDVSLTEVVPDIAQQNEWQSLSVTKTAPASGSVRVALTTNSSYAGDLYFDAIDMPIDYLLEGDDSDRIFFGNLSLKYNLTHIFRYDDSLTSYSGNLLNDSLPYQLIASSTATDDELLFGSVDGPFSSVLFDVGSVVDATTFTLDWEYMDYTGTWQTLTVIDNTNDFSVGGKNVVVWDIPNDIGEGITVNSIDAWWVKAKVSAVSGMVSLPYQANFHIQTVAKPYFDVVAANVGGDLDALARYIVFNELGPSKDSSVFNLSASADDASIDRGGTSISTSGLEDKIQESHDLAVRFQSIAIPQGARITRARIICTPGDRANGNQTDWFSSVVVRIYGEDADTSSAWTDYSNYIGRTRTTAYKEWTCQLNGWGFGSHIGQNNNEMPDITTIIQEIIDRDGWVSGNNLTLFLQGHDSSHSTADYGTMYMDEKTGAGIATEKWILEVDWITQTRYTTSMIMGSRSLSRGADFSAFLNANALGNPAGVEIRYGANTFAYRISYHHGNTTQRDGSLVANGIGAGVYSHVRQWDDRIIFTIYNPLAEQYTGRFRAFVRMKTRDIGASGIPTNKVRLRASVGLGGSSFTNSATFNLLADAELIDLGAVVIPSAKTADSIVLAIQTSADYPAGGPATPVETLLEIQDLILMPVDEWSIEATSPGTDIQGYLDGNSFLELDSIDSRPSPIVASIKDKKSERARAFMVTSGNRATLSPVGDQRVWAVTTSYVDKPGTFINTPPVASRHEASLSQVVHSASVEAVTRYLAMRGSL